MNYRSIEINGCRVTLWDVRCNDCGFLTGLALVEHPDGHTHMICGAGCFETPRRNPQVALTWATEKALLYKPGHQARPSVALGDQVDL